MEYANTMKPEFMTKNNTENFTDLGEYSDEDNMVQNDEVQTQVEYKTYSPDASLKRFEKLPEIVRTSFDRIDIMFTVLIDEILNRVRLFKSNNDLTSFESMWTRIVLTNCMGFRKNHFSQLANDIQVDEKVRGYFSLTPIPDLLQSFNDVAQLAGYRTENKDKDLTDMYHAFVELYKKCTGNWRHKKKPFHRTFNPSYNNRQNNSYDYNQNSYGNRQKKSYQPGSYDNIQNSYENRQKKSYQPGSYDNIQNSYGNRQKKSYQPGSYDNGRNNNVDQTQGEYSTNVQRGQFNKNFSANMPRQDQSKTFEFREGGNNCFPTPTQHKYRTAKNN